MLFCRERYLGKLGKVGRWELCLSRRLVLPSSLTRDRHEIPARNRELVASIAYRAKRCQLLYSQVIVVWWKREFQTSPATQIRDQSNLPQETLQIDLTGQTKTAT